MNCHGWRIPLGLLIAVPMLAGCRAPAPKLTVDCAVVQSPNKSVATEHPPRRLPPAEQSASRVALASYTQDLDELPVPPEPDDTTTAPDEIIATPAALNLDDVIRSVQQSYPLLVSVLLERQIAEGKQLSAWGAFDLGIKASGIAGPEGYYQTYRNAIALDQPVMSGGYLYGGYRIGDGNFQPWYGGRGTNEGGEFAAGFGVPLLKDRSIDKRREALFRAGLARQAVEPVIRAELLEFVRLSSGAYWSWVASGQMVEAQRELLRLAEARADQVEERVNAGDLARIALINNEQLIASRETKLIEAERKLQEAAIKLSLFVRNFQGQPTIPAETQLPEVFPPHAPPDPQQLDADIARAVAARPELVELRLVAEQVRVELAQAENMLLPKLDAQLLASKDVGGWASSKGDKTPFELEVGLYGDVPLQRREARGKIEAARGKLAQLDAKRQFVTNKVTAAVQDAVSALTAAAGRIERASTNLRLARDTLALGREQFNAGDLEVIALNIYEQSVTDAQLQLIAAQADFFIAMADYRAALSMDPLPVED